MRLILFIENLMYVSSHTSTSSLYFNKGACITLAKLKVSDSTLKKYLHNLDNFSQCLLFIALLAIISNNGHISLKSSIFFFKSMYAGHSRIVLGNFRHLKIIYSIIKNFIILYHTTNLIKSICLTCFGSQSNQL